MCLRTDKKKKKKNSNADRLPRRIGRRTETALRLTQDLVMAIPEPDKKNPPDENRRRRENSDPYLKSRAGNERWKSALSRVSLSTMTRDSEC